MSRSLKPPVPTRSAIVTALSLAVDKSGLTQLQVAERAGYLPSQISHLRLRRGSRFQITFYEDVAEALGYEFRLVRKTSWRPIHITKCEEME